MPDLVILNTKRPHKPPWKKCQKENDENLLLDRESFIFQLRSIILTNPSSADAILTAENQLIRSRGISSRLQSCMRFLESQIFFFLLGPFHIIGTSQILINYSQSLRLMLFFFFSILSHQVLALTKIFTINIIMSWAHSLKWPLASLKRQLASICLRFLANCQNDTVNNFLLRQKKKRCSQWSGSVLQPIQTAVILKVHGLLQ